MNICPSSSQTLPSDNLLRFCPGLMFSALLSSDSESEVVTDQPVASQVDHEVVDAQPISTADLLKMRVPKAEPDFIPPLTVPESAIKTKKKKTVIKDLKEGPGFINLHITMIHGPLIGQEYLFSFKATFNLHRVIDKLQELTGFDHRCFCLSDMTGLYLIPSLLIKDVSRELTCTVKVPCGLDEDGKFPVRVLFIKDRETGEVGSEMEIKVEKKTTFQRLAFIIEELVELPHNSFQLYTKLATLKNSGCPKYYNMKVFWFAFDFSLQMHVVYLAMGLGAELDMFDPIPDSESDEEDDDECYEEEESMMKVKILWCGYDAGGFQQHMDEDLEVQKNITVEILHVMIEELTGVAVADQEEPQHSESGVVLRDGNKTLAEYGVQNGHTIIVCGEYAYQ